MEVDVVELSLQYMNMLASQTLFISGLLCGFSLTVLVLLLDQKWVGKLTNYIFQTTAVATGAFLVCIFAMTNVYMKTTPGYPMEVTFDDTFSARIVGMLAFFIGTVAMCGILALSGWTKSRKLGIFSTIVGSIALIFSIWMQT